MNVKPHVAKTYIGIGSNLGDACGNVRAALNCLGKLPDTTLSAQSSLFQTAPIDADGADYINAVAKLNTQLSPQALLQELQEIEQSFGRERLYHNAHMHVHFIPRFKHAFRTPQLGIRSEDSLWGKHYDRVLAHHEMLQEYKRKALNEIVAEAIA